ncbi:hypothetical protein SAMN02745784_01154 [Tissierella praeacuta DSM 18095]|uniref:Uncharacterized protein n=1 Tax=Tissierella praeacuta DSM 18095 TaxID=1123404 RepID=A0A1M4UL73_9FIRM|nr:hypothetical protein [Tissierella praeacuta]TCU68927.1 hypothetical protein EV204_10960 [Tissierella praeacuta]SHE57522.1 hypothetical protein SAMN02745784_01154 [Tissierella praeacuta DSM 18095]SUP03578.1 Uncharacterised protein [Tissierella praeacuta]
MKIERTQFTISNFMQNNKQIKGFKPWNSKNIISGQNIFGFNMTQNKDKKIDDGGSIASIMSKKIKDDIIADKIAKKIARGEKLTEEEKAKIMEIDPEKLRKAEMANRRREEIESRLKNAKSEKEARDIILEAKMEARIISDKGDIKYGEYLIEAVNKAEQNYNNKDIKESKDIIKDVLDKDKGKFFDIKL